MSRNRSSNALTAWAIVAIIALLGLNAYQWIINKQLKEGHAQIQTEMFELEKVSAELDQDYQAALAGLEELRGDNLELNTLIDSQKKELAAQKKKINNLIWSKRELDKAREEISNLRSLADQYIAKSNQLYKENEILTARNKKLSDEKAALQAQYTIEKEVNAELNQARAVLAAEKEKLAEEKKVLDVKVDIAKAIKVNWLEVKGYKVSDNGKVKKKSKAKDINMLRTCFLTETNVIAKTGATKFMIRLIDPLGETLFFNDLGGGILTNKLTNTQVRYTTSGIMEYNNNDTRGCIDWDVPVKLAKGEYEIEIYNNDFMVGKGGFKLK